MYRGYDAAQAASERPKSPSNGDVVPAKRKADFQDAEDSPKGIAMNFKEEEREVKMADQERRSPSGTPCRSPPPVGNEGSEEITDLVLIIHGIGQGVCPSSVYGFGITNTVCLNS